MPKLAIELLAIISGIVMLLTVIAKGLFKMFKNKKSGDTETNNNFFSTQNKTNIEKTIIKNSKSTREEIVEIKQNVSLLSKAFLIYVNHNGVDANTKAIINELLGENNEKD